MMTLIRVLLCFAIFGVATPATAGLLPDLFGKVKLTREIWRDQEQYVALGPRGDKDAAFPANKHPVQLDMGDVRDALRSLALWEKGGFLRDEESKPVFTQGQAEALGRYLPNALARAKPDEDVFFVVRGYGGVMLDTVKEREWTSGRAFFVDGRLNLIIGSLKTRKDRGKRNAEAAAGVLNDYSDVYFSPGNRREQSASMSGRIVSTAGVSFSGGETGNRPDWILIDVKKAAIAYREGLVPEEEKKRETVARQEAAKLTLERRQMREEMARLRAELKSIKGQGADARSVEDRLATLQELKTKALISEEEYRRRRDEILGDI